MASRVTEILSKIPLVTASLLIFNCGVHAIIFLFSLSINDYAISANRVLKGEYYRIVSAAYVHGGIMHIFMNMSSLLQLGASLETQFGSAQFALLTLWSTLLIGAVYVFLSWVAAVAMNDVGQLRSSGVGFSGVLFCYAIIEANHTVEVTRSFYGMFNVPAKLMPFLLLVVLQVIIPNVSWLGHLSGVIVGLFCISEGMALCMTSEAFPECLEQNIAPFSTISRLSSYVRSTSKSLIISSSTGICGTVTAGVGLIFRQMWNVLAVVLHIIGFPTDRCCGALGICFGPLYSTVGACCRPRQQSTMQPMMTASSPSRVEEGGAWNGGGSGGSTGGTGSTVNSVGGRGRTLGGRGTTSTLTAPTPSNATKAGYTPLVQEV